MKILEVKPLAFPEVKLIRFARFPDERGFFTETFRKSELVRELQDESFTKSELVQCNMSYSIENVIRGLHFQWQPYQGKLIRVIDGMMIDLFLDIRINSPTLGKIGAVRLEQKPQNSEDQMIWIPKGFAHGVAFLEKSYIEYYCTVEYSPETEAGIFPLSQDIDWSLCDPELKSEFDNIAKNSLISEKDKKGLTIAQWKTDKRSENYS
jgi:dTDP-4-dehydrorhamnose 3,5-epimerase